MAKGAAKRLTVWPVVSAAEMAEALGITSRRLRQLEAEGWFKKDGRDSYSSREAFGGYIKFLKDEGRRTSKSAGANEAAQARARLYDVQTEEKTGELKREAVEQAMLAVDAVIGPLKSDLYAVAPRVTRDVALRKKIEAEVERVLKAASLATRRARSGKIEGGRPARAGGEDFA